MSSESNHIILSPEVMAGWANCLREAQEAAMEAGSICLYVDEHGWLYRLYPDHFRQYLKRITRESFNPAEQNTDIPLLTGHGVK